MKFTYFIIDLLVFLPVLLLSFLNKSIYYYKFRQLFIALFLGAFFFILWDVAFTKLGVWGFNPKYVLGMYFINLPIEEVLFFIFIPFSSLFIYEVLRNFVKNLTISWLKLLYLAIGIAMMLGTYINYLNIYTGFVMFLAVIISFYLIISKKYKDPYLFLFLIISYLPFVIVNSLLTSIPVVIYNSSWILNIRFLNIPLEDFIYSYIMLTFFYLIYRGLDSKNHAIPL